VKGKLREKGQREGKRRCKKEVQQVWNNGQLGDNAVREGTARSRGGGIKGRMGHNFSNWVGGAEGRQEEPAQRPEGGWRVDHAMGGETLIVRGNSQRGRRRKMQSGGQKNTNRNGEENRHGAISSSTSCKLDLDGGGHGDSRGILSSWKYEEERFWKGGIHYAGEARPEMWGKRHKCMEVKFHSIAKRGQKNRREQPMSLFGLGGDSRKKTQLVRIPPG